MNKSGLVIKPIKGNNMNKYFFCGFFLSLFWSGVASSQNLANNCLTFSELYEKQNGLFYEIKTGNLFSGIIVETINNDKDTIRKTNYWKGKAEGFDSSFYDNKNVESCYLNKNGLFDGPFYVFFRNGNVYEQGFYKKGNSNGIFNQYSIEGNLRIKGNYINGNKVGKWYFYNKDASIERIEIYNSRGKLKKILPS